jgi:hypothetical protein
MRVWDRQLIQKFFGIFGSLHGVALMLANHYMFTVNRDDPFVVAGVRHGVMLHHRTLLSFVCSIRKGAGGSLIIDSSFTKNEDSRRKPVMVYAPYRGWGPAMTDLLGGQVQVSST